MTEVSAVIVAAGEGRRFGAPKQFALLGGKTVLEWCLRAFQTHERITDIVLVLDNEERSKPILNRYTKISAVTRGGQERQDSVYAGFLRLNASAAPIVLVHDGARPLVEPALIDRVIDAALETGAAVPVLPVEETVKRIESHRVVETVDRTKLFRVQTPQGFRYDVLKTALEKARQDGFYGTDEAALVERTGCPIKAVQGEAKNLKITTPEDIRIAETLLGV